MKIKINTILPAALALILPWLNLFSTADSINGYTLEFYWKWGCASLVLYTLWYVLLASSQIEGKYKTISRIAVVSVFLFLIYLFFSLMVFKDNTHIKWVFFGKFASAAILFSIIQYALKASRDIARLKLEKEQIQTENYRAQLQELRLKIDPHFLFNSMNTLRTMVRSGNLHSEEFIINLSNFYRQTLRLNHSSAVSLLEEVEVLKSFLFLMQMRNEGKLKVDLSIDEKWSLHLIPTLCLQIVVENCFKHNQASAAHPLEISVRTEDGFISIKNNLQPKLSKSETSGYGLENIKRRYELLGITDGIIVEQSAEYFEVKLKLM